MKVMYLASSTPEMENLELEREITAMQRRVQGSAGDDARFIFLPDVKLEEVGLELTKQRPDVLHISVHGDRAGLWFGTQDGRSVNLTAQALIDLLPLDHRPRLIVLNACESMPVAKALAFLPLVAIGTTAPITNQAAIASATLLYDRLLSGATIESAYRAMDALVRTLEEQRTSLELFCSVPGLENTVLHRSPQIVAKLPSGRRAMTKHKITALIGLAGCPPDTTQVTFFTDDPSFLTEDEDLEGELTEVVRDAVRGGEMWTEELWEGNGDFRIAACGITGSGRTFSSSAMLSDALEHYASVTPSPEAYRAELPEVLAFLRDRLGAGLADWQPPPATTSALPDRQPAKGRARRRTRS